MIIELETIKNTLEITGLVVLQPGQGPGPGQRPAPGAAPRRPIAGPTIGPAWLAPGSFDDQRAMGWKIRIQL